MGQPLTLASGRIAARAGSKDMKALAPFSGTVDAPSLRTSDARTAPVSVVAWTEMKLPSKAMSLIVTGSEFSKAGFAVMIVCSGRT